MPLESWFGILEYLDMVLKADGQTNKERQKAAGGGGLFELVLKTELYMAEFWDALNWCIIGSNASDLHLV